MTTPIIDDIKRSIIETVRARSPDIPEDNFFSDPPQGVYERPCFYLVYHQSRRFPTAGMILYQHDFDAVIEVIESQTDVQPVEVETDITKKTRLMEEALQEGNMIPFYHFEDSIDDSSGEVVTVMERREGYIEVRKFSIQEGVKDRQKNAIKGILTLIF